MPGWVRAKLLQQSENTTVEDLCISARKQLPMHNLSKTDDSVMDAFIEMGHSVTDTLNTALTNLTTSQETIENRLNEMPKKFEERKTFQRINLTSSRRIKHNSPRGFFSQNRGPN